MYVAPPTQSHAEGPAVFASRAERRKTRQQVPSHQPISRKASTAARACRYGGLAVSAWLLTAVATGNGVAAADNPSSLIVLVEQFVDVVGYQLD